jgi:hypothetical protein
LDSYFQPQAVLHTSVQVISKRAPCERRQTTEQEWRFGFKLMIFAEENEVQNDQGHHEQQKPGNPGIFGRQGDSLKGPPTELSVTLTPPDFREVGIVCVLWFRNFAALFFRENQGLEETL